MPPQWSLMADFEDGLAAVIQDDFKMGYINKTGDMVVPAKWDEVGRFRDGLARFKDNGKYGYLNGQGEVVHPAVWMSAGDFRGGLALVHWAENVVSVINTQGEIVFGYVPMP